MNLKIGFTPWRNSPSHDLKSLCQQAIEAESWGYDTLFLPEHHFSGRGAIPDPLMLLAGVASVTSRLRLATTSYLLPLRNPILAAEQVAVLDQISNGRVVLGIGRGYAKGLFDVFQVNPRHKRNIFARNLEIMIRAWKGESVSTDDDTEQLSISPLPFQKPHPKIYVAAFGPLAFKQAGKLGLPYLAAPMETKEKLLENYAKHRAASAAEDVMVPKDTPIMRTVFVSEDEREVETVKNRLDREIRNVNTANDPQGRRISANDWAIVGSPSYFTDVIDEYKDTLNITELVITRLRIGGVPESSLANSVYLSAKTILG